MALEQKLPGVTKSGSGLETLVAGVALFSKEAAKLAAFYEKVLQIKFVHRVHEDGREHHIARLGGVQFEIKALFTASGERTSDASVTNAEGVSRSENSFQVSDVAGASARALINGARVVSKAQQYDWGTFAVLLDPDGNRLGLFTPPAEEASDSMEDKA